MSPFNNSIRMGALRTILYTYILVRSNGGIVYIKCDDTNPNSRNKNYFKKQLEDLSSCGLRFLENELINPSGYSICQSENDLIYHTYLKKLENKGLLSEKEGLISLDVKALIRLLSSEKLIITDILRGKIVFESSSLGYEFIPLFLKEEKRFLFHIPAIVDDHLYDVTLLVRGEDKISVAPIHELLKTFFDIKHAPYLHLPLILDPKTKKRLKGEVFSLENVLKNFSVDVIVSYLLQSGYRDSKMKYISIVDFIKDFELSKLKKKSGFYGEADLDKIQQKYIKMTNKN